MSKPYFINFRVATPTGPADAVAEVYQVAVGRSLATVAVHDGTLSDFRSGRRLADLSPLLKARGITKANAAQIAVDRLYAAHGKVLEKALRAAPLLNQPLSTTITSA